MLPPICLCPPATSFPRTPTLSPPERSEAPHSVAERRRRHHPTRDLSIRALFHNALTRFVSIMSVLRPRVVSVIACSRQLQFCAEGLFKEQARVAA